MLPACFLHLKSLPSLRMDENYWPVFRSESLPGTRGRLGTKSDVTPYLVVTSGRISHICKLLKEIGFNGFQDYDCKLAAT